MKQLSNLFTGVHDDVPVLRGWLTKNWLEEISEALIIKADSIQSSDKGLDWLLWDNLSLETREKALSWGILAMDLWLSKDTKKFQGKQKGWTAAAKYQSNHLPLQSSNSTHRQQAAM